MIDLSDSSDREVMELTDPCHVIVTDGSDEAERHVLMTRAAADRELRRRYPND